MVTRFRHKLSAFKKKEIFNSCFPLNQRICANVNLYTRSWQIKIKIALSMPVKGFVSPPVENEIEDIIRISIHLET